MTDLQILNEKTLAREWLSHVCDEKSIVHPVLRTLALIGRNSVGLGEVLQDYARQGCDELQDVVRVAGLVNRGADLLPEDAEVLGNIVGTFKAVKSVLERTPAAMLRNKADTLGEKEKLSRADITRMADAFLRAPEIARMLGSDTLGNAVAALGTGHAPAAHLPAGQESTGIHH